jgi:hypothetical protein
MPACIRQSSRVPWSGVSAEVMGGISPAHACLRWDKHVVWRPHFCRSLLVERMATLASTWSLQSCALLKVFGLAIAGLGVPACPQPGCDSRA